MNFRQTVQQLIIHSLVLTLLLFIAFNKLENGDMNVVIFGTVLYLPYVLIITGLNLFLMSLGLKIINKRPFVFLVSLLTSIVLTTLFLLDGQIEVRYWKFTLIEFVILNFAIISLNLLTITRLTTSQIKNETI